MTAWTRAGRAAAFINNGEPASSSGEGNDNRRGNFHQSGHYGVGQNVNDTRHERLALREALMGRLAAA
jgi:hypothetical protein